MSVATIEEDYQNLNSFKAQVEILRYELVTLELTGISAMNYDGVGHSSNVSNPTETEVINYNSRMEYLKNQIIILEQKIKILEEAMKIFEINSHEYLILIRRVINGEVYYRICGDLKIGERHARRIKYEVIQKLAKTINVLKMS